jgi:hypothetical protein
MLKQHQVRQHVTRSLIHPAMIGLLRRTEGMHLLQYNEGLDKLRGTAPLGNGSPIEFSQIMAEGFSVDRLEMHADGSSTAHCSKLVGLKYPVAGFSYTYSSPLELLPGEREYPEYQRVQSLAADFFV